ncbi:hypothetical protein JCM11491_004370 [Sporobolomyces phaffii]
MDHQRIRPSLADLASLDLDAPAFSEWELNNAPAVSVSRTKPPTILSTSIPPPVPEIPFDEPQPSNSSPKFAATPPAKPKSRFALQREKEAAEKATEGKGTERFELDLDEHGDGIDSRAGGALPTATPRPSLVKDVLERPATRNAPPRPPTAPTLHGLGSRPAGFPPLGKGVFPRKTALRTAVPPSVPAPSTSSLTFDADKYVDGGTVDGILQSVSKENENVLSGMSELQILEEQRQIREEMGLSEGMIKMLQERAQKKLDTGSTRRNRPPPPQSPATSARLHPPRTAPRQQEDDDEDEEGTPEYIRKHFFPDEPVNPALDWMKPTSPSSTRPSDEQSSLPTTFTFDLQGSLVSSSSTATPEANAGDHHVSSASSFTIPSLLSLTASSVPSQRSTAFTTLHRIISHSSRHCDLVGPKDWASLRHELVQKAGWALRDPARGVVISAIDLLAYLLETEAASPPPPAAAPLPNAEVAKTFLESFESADPFPPLSMQMSLAGSTLPGSSLVQVLGIVEHFVALAPPASLDVVFSTRNLLAAFVERFIATPWPPPSSHSTSDSSTRRVGLDDDDTVSTRLPCPRAIALVSSLARSSRARAKLLWSDRAKLIEPTLRYLAIPPWDLDVPGGARERGDVDVQKLGYEMLTNVFELWHVFARYGIGCQLRTLAAPLLEDEGGVFERVVVEAGHQEKAAWVGALLRLMTVWTIASIDPHVTEHDIVWSQVEGWNDLALEVYGVAAEKGRKGLVGQSLDLLANWLEGSKVNKSWRGEKEREWIKDRFEHDLTEGRGRKLIEGAMRALAACRTEEEDDNNARVVSAALRLSRAYEESSNPPTSALFTLDPELVEAVVDTVLALPERPSSGAVEVTLVLLPLVSDSSRRLEATIRLLPLLEPSQAVAARDLVSHLLATLAKPAPSLSHQLALVSSLEPTLEIPVLADLPLLEPFYVHLIVTSSGGRVIGPSHPTPRDIKLTHSLSTTTSRLLSHDWPLAVLDELLRSATSPVFQRPPKDWDPSEVQLVKACLVLMRVVLAGGGGRVRVERAVMLYDLMKVFMLEKDTDPSSATERDLFLNPSIQHSVSHLVEPLRFSSLAPSSQLLAQLSPTVTPFEHLPPLEAVSNRFSTAPFYQLYTDFLGLYDSISLLNALFAQFLLPPCSQRYSIDYRKLLWTDYSHLLAGITLDAPDLLSDREDRDADEGLLQGWLYPRERDETLLRTYLDQLLTRRVTPSVNPFLSWVAVHHVSQAIFGEDDQRDAEASNLRTKLVTNLMAERGDEVTRMILRYQPIETGESRMRQSLEECVEAGGNTMTLEEKEARNMIILKVVGTQVETRVRSLLG